METSRTMQPEQGLGESLKRRVESEWNAVGLRPVAHWVLMPAAGGGRKLSMVWTVPDPMPPGSSV